MQPDCQDILDSLEDNRNWYMNQVPSAHRGASSSGAAGGGGGIDMSDDDDDDEEEFVDCESATTTSQ